MSETQSETAAPTTTTNNDRLKQILHEIVSYLPASAEAIATNLHSLIDAVDSFEDIHETPVGVPGAGMPVEPQPTGLPGSQEILNAIQGLATTVQGVVADVEALKSGNAVTTENPPAGAGGVA